MSIHERVLPVPYVEIDAEGNILSYSAAAKQEFSLPAAHISALIDEGSMGKFLRYGFQTGETSELELNLITKHHPAAAFDVQISWDSSEHGQIVFLAKQDRISKLEDQLLSLHQRLESTNFELFEKKEELELTMERLRKLSGPYIALSREIALIPLFGDLSEETLKAITEQVVQKAYEGQQSTLLFDFTAVDEITLSGISRLLELFQILSCMDKPVLKIAGVKPEHSRQMNQYQKDWPCEFVPTLEIACRELFFGRKASGSIKI